MSRVQSTGAAPPAETFTHEEPEPAAVRRAADRPGEVSVRTGHLTFHGGKVLQSPDVVPVYVGAYWQTVQGRRDRARNDAALEALVKDPGQTGIWAQYGSGRGTTSPSHVLPTASRASFSAADVEALVRKQVAAGAFDASDPERIFTVVLAPGVVLRDGDASSRQGLGGFHGSVVAADGHPVYYAVVVYSQRVGRDVNGIDFTSAPIDNMTITESHEITEAVTDPDVGLAARTGNARYLGWYDDTTPIVGRDGRPLVDGFGAPMRGKGEIGDIPVLNAELEGDATLRTVWGRREGFAFQTEWSNRDGKAELAPETGSD
jgi:hypothetical protein